MSATTASRSTLNLNLDLTSLVTLNVSSLQLTLSTIIDAINKHDSMWKESERRAEEAERREKEIEKELHTLKDKMSSLEKRLEQQEQQSKTTQSEVASQAAMLVRVQTAQATAAQTPASSSVTPALTPQHHHLLTRLGSIDLDSLIQHQQHSASTQTSLTHLQEKLAVVESAGLEGEGRIGGVEVKVEEVVKQVERMRKEMEHVAVSQSQVSAPAPTTTTTTAASDRRSSNITDALTARVSKIQSMQEATQSKVALMESQIAALRNAANANTGTTTSSETSSISDAQLASLVSDITSLRSAVDSMQDSLSNKADRDDLATSGGASRSDLASMDDRVVSMESSLREMRREEERMKDDTRELARGMKRLEDRVNAGATAAPPSSTRPASATPQLSRRTSAITSSAPVSTTDDPTRRWAEEIFSGISRHNASTRADIQELYNLEKVMRGNVERLSKAAEEKERNGVDVVQNMKKLDAELRSHLANSSAQTRSYLDSRLDDFLSKLKEFEKGVEKGVKTEMKRFEKDVLVFVSDGGANGASGINGTNGTNGHSHSHHNHGHDAAVGKIHFRCLSCDQQVPNLHGPSSLLYSRAVANGGSSTVIQQQLPPGSGTSMSIDRGAELFLNGRDGSVYRGRDASIVTIAPGDPSSRSQFSVSYTERGLRNTAAAQANPRGSSIVDQKTIFVPNTPNSAPSGNGSLPIYLTTQRGSGGNINVRPHTAQDESVTRRESLPSTRPATRGTPGQLTARSTSRKQLTEATVSEEKQVTQTEPAEF